MHDHQLYLRTLSEFTRALLTPYDAHAALGELATRVTDVLGIIGSGVSLAEGDKLVFDAGVDNRVVELERIQDETQAGPCVTAFRSGEVVAVSDLTTEADRWPVYCAAAASLGIRSVASIPMRLGERRVGALNLYDEHVRAWDVDDTAAAVVLADMATSYLINASTHHQQVLLAEQLQRALDSRVVLEQAKGMIAARHGLAPDVAFERMRAHARARGVTIRSIAEAVVQLGLDLKG